MTSAIHVFPRKQGQDPYLRRASLLAFVEEIGADDLFDGAKEGEEDVEMTLRRFLQRMTRVDQPIDHVEIYLL